MFRVKYVLLTAKLILSLSLHIPLRLAQHPEIEDAWKFVGRLDDTLVMVNGEKTSPVSIESTLRGTCNSISDAVVFGGGRSQIGALIILSPSVDESLSPSALFHLIKPAIDLANSAAPSHSQLSEEMIVFFPSTTVIPRADKGSFLRPKVYAQFKDVIDGVYRRLEGEDEEGGAEKKAVGSVEEVETYLKAVVAKIAGREECLAKETDLFEFGLDSLEAGRIRNQLQRVSQSSRSRVAPLARSDSFSISLLLT